MARIRARHGDTLFSEDGAHGRREQVARRLAGGLTIATAGSGVRGSLAAVAARGARQAGG